MNTLRTLKITLIVTFIALVGMGFLLSNKTNNPSGLGTLGGDFTLTAASGPVSLSDYRGKVVALYIGYAACPDVCPTSLAVMTQAFRSLDDNEIDQVAGLFISVDPDRDTPEKLDTYVKFFHPSITGITGTKERIDEVVKQYGAFYRKVEMKDSAMGYAVDHSSRIYLIDRKGKLRTTFLHNSSPDDLLVAIKDILTEDR